MHALCQLYFNPISARNTASTGLIREFRGKRIPIESSLIAFADALGHKVAIISFAVFILTIVGVNISAAGDNCCWSRVNPWINLSLGVVDGYHGEDEKCQSLAGHCCNLFLFPTEPLLRISIMSFIFERNSYQSYNFLERPALLDIFTQSSSFAHSKLLRIRRL